MESLRVLVIDDSSVSAAAIKLAISKDPAFLHVASVGTAAEAIERCKISKPDVVTLDLNLPGGGLEMLSEIKAACNTPIMVVSASTYEGSPVTAEAYCRGADACFDKARVLTDVDTFLQMLRLAAIR